MTEKEQELETALSDLGVCCESCKYLHINAGLTEYYCNNFKNDQTGVYGAQKFKVIGKSFSCCFWKENKVCQD